MNVTQLHGNIVALRREREEDHRHDTLALWERSAKAASPALPWSSVDKLGLDELLSMARGATHVAISCSQQAPEIMKGFLETLSGRTGPRVYLYAPASWQDEKWLRTLLLKSPGRLLVRLGIEPPGDWVVTDSHTAGRLFLGPPGVARRWALTLDAEGARTLYQAFCWLFWQRATLEAIPGTLQGGFQRCLPVPFPDPTSARALGTSPASGSSAAGIVSPPGTTAGASTASTTSPAPGISLPLARGTLLTQPGPLPLLPFPELVVSPDGAPWPGTPAKVLVPHDRADFALLRQHSARGASLVWTGLDLPRLALTRQRLALALEEGPIRLQLELESQDAIALMHGLDEVERHPEWRFHGARKLAEVKGPVWLEGARGTIQVEERVELRMGRLQAQELEAMQKLEPASWRRPDTPARTWRFTWEVEPPRAPEGAREARLVQEWRRLDEYVTAQGEALRRQLKAMEEEEASSGLLTRLAGLVKPWDSVKRRRRQIAEVVDELLEDRVSRRPAEAPDLLHRLEAQYEAIRALRREAREAEEREELRLAEEQQRSKYDQGRAEKKVQIDALETRIRQLQDARREKTSAKEQVGLELSEQEKAWQESLEAGREERAARLDQERLELEAKRDALKEEVRQLQERMKSAKKDEKKTLGKEQAQKSGELGQIKEQLEVLSAGQEPMPPAPEELQSLRAQAGTVEKELKELDAKEATLQHQLDAAHGEFNREFVFKRPAPSKRPLKLEELAPRPPIPSEHPPELGRLLEHGNTRYLEVATWELAERARKVAECLGAKRVAPL